MALAPQSLCVGFPLFTVSSTKLFVCLGLARVLFIVVAGVFVTLGCVLAVSRRSDSVWQRHWQRSARQKRLQR